MACGGHRPRPGLTSRANRLAPSAGLWVQAGRAAARHGPAGGASACATVAASRMTARTVYRFAGFELDPLALELRPAGGARIPAQEHPLRLLLALLRRPGQVVPRGELAAALWPPGTFVDAEHGLNTAIRKLRQALGESSERPALLETAKRRGYRLATTVEVVIPASGPSVAVLPLSGPTAAADHAHLAEGLAEELGQTLRAIAGLHVASHRDAVRSRDATPEHAGLALGVRHVLAGTLRIEADRCRIGWHLIEVGSGREIWKGRFDRRLADLLALEEEVAREVARSVVVHLVPDSEGPSHQVLRPASVTAYDLCLRARAAWRLRGHSTLRAVSLLERALEIEPGYPPALQALAACYYSSAAGGHLPSREAAQRLAWAAQRSLAVAPREGASWAVEGMRREWLERAPRRAEEAYRTALARAPRETLAYGWLALLLASRGRFEEAIGAARQGHALDPGAPPTAAHLGWTLFFARRYDDALAVLEPAPDFAVAWIVRAWILERAGRLEAALAALDEAATTNETRWARRERVRILAAMGRSEEAHEALAALVELGAHFSPFERALLALARGDCERTLAELALAHAERDPWTRFWRVDPRLDALRDRSGFRLSGLRASTRDRKRARS